MKYSAVQHCSTATLHISPTSQNTHWIYNPNPLPVNRNVSVTEHKTFRLSITAVTLLHNKQNPLLNVVLVHCNNKFSTCQTYLMISNASVNSITRYYFSYGSPNSSFVSRHCHAVMKQSPHFSIDSVHHNKCNHIELPHPHQSKCKTNRPAMLWFNDQTLFT